MTLGEAHIYGGLLALAVGIAIAVDPGWGLAILGLGFIPLGFLLARIEDEDDEDEEVEEIEQSQVRALMTASVDQDVTVSEGR